MNKDRGKCVAIITGIFSILIGALYLLIITILDSRGPMLPPPPEALSMVEVVFSFYSYQPVGQLYLLQF